MRYETVSYSERERGSGDPVVVYRVDTQEAHSIGTGYTSLHDVAHEIERRFDVENEEFKVFGMEASVTFDVKNESKTLKSDRDE